MVCNILPVWGLARPLFMTLITLTISVGLDTVQLDSPSKIYLSILCDLYFLGF